MSAITFDTHQFVKKLQAKGISEEQSEAIIDAMVSIQQASTDKFFTNIDAERYKSEMKQDFQKLESKMDLLEQRLIIKMGAMMIGLAGFLSIIKFFG